MKEKFLLCVFLLVSAVTQAGITTSQEKYTGSQLNNNAPNLLVEEDFYDEMLSNPTWQNLFVNTAVKNRIRLVYTGADRQNNLNAADWTATVTFDLEVKDETGTVISTLTGQSLSISNNVIILNGPNPTTINQSILELDDSGYSLEVKNFTFVGLPSNSEDFEFIAEIETERYFNLPYATSLVHSVNYGHNEVAIDNSGCFNIAQTQQTWDNQLNVYWAFISGAEEYELEWYLNSAENADQWTTTTIADINNVAAIDWTRITITNNNYTINLPFDDGNLFYRVRPVGRFLADPTKKFFGAWSPVGEYQVYNNELKKNWQYSATYAEEGKVKEVVGFFDGSGRNRQTVTRSSTENVSLITETMYDYEGRPVIQTLPAPNVERSQNLGFHCGYSLNAGNILLEKKDYDFFLNCDLNAPLLGTNEGGSNYYSANNLDRNIGENQVIPDAEQYPYTQSVLALDGRVKFQSAPGSKHSITDNGTVSDNRFTKFFYATPLQYKLDRLFGNEVGYASHYKLKAVEDANGQVSLSYLDLSDNVVATSLIGQEPANLDALASNSGVGNVVADFNNLNNYDVTTESYVINSSFLVEVTGDHKFNYSLTPEVVTELCTNTDFGCVYDLVITIFDDCDIRVDDQGVLTGQTSSGNNEVLHTQYITLNTAVSTTGSFNVDFPKIGTYAIKKVLKLNEAALNTAAESFKTIYEDNCLIPNNLPVDPDACLSCIDYCALYPSECATEECNTPYTGCSSLLEQLIVDMSPGGQYFNASGWLDVFVTPSRIPLPSSPTLPEIIAHGIATTTWDDLGFTTSGGTPIYNWTDVAANWQSSWATDLPGTLISEMGVPLGGLLGVPDQGLVGAHTEYCHYVACVAMEPSLQFNQDFSAQTTLPSNFNANGITGVSAYSVSNMEDVVGAMIGLDPFFTTLGLASVAQMEQIGGTVYTSVDPAGNSIYEDIDAMVLSNLLYLPSSPNINDVWPIIRAAYLDHKNIWVKEYKETASCYYLSDYKDAAGNIGVFDNKAETYQSPMYPSPSSIPSNLPFALNQDAYSHWQTKFLGINPLIPDVFHISYFTGFDIRVPDYQDFFNLVNSGNSDAITAGFPANIEDFGNNFGTNMPVPFNDNCLGVQMISNADLTQLNTTGCTGIVLNDGYGYPVDCATDWTDLNNNTADFFNDMPGLPGRFLNLRRGAGATGTSEAISNTLAAQIIPGKTYKLSFKGCSSLPTWTVNQLLISFSDAQSFNDDLSDPQYGPLGIHEEIMIPYGGVQGTNIPAWPNWTPISITWTATMSVPADYMFFYIAYGEDDAALYAKDFELKEVLCDPLVVEFDCFCTQMESAKDVYAIDNGYTLPLNSTQLTAFQSYIANEFNNNYPSLSVTITDSDVAQWMSNCDATVDPNLNLAGDAPSAMSPVKLDVPDEIYCEEDDCLTQSINIANYYNNQFDELEVENAVSAFITQYKAECFGGSFDEDFTVEFQDREYHHTLYYYDRAGNLVQTIPPQGVDKLVAAPTQAVDDYRTAGTGSATYPDHKFRTQYKYNTLNQLVEQVTPDGGVTKFWYDDIGRLKASQNEKQLNVAPTAMYSYTAYDAQGRIIEVGELESATIPNTTTILNDADFPAVWLAMGNPLTYQVTYTEYDATLNSVVNNLFGADGQQNLRNRVASTYLKDISSDADWQHASHYSYDIHGNVEKLITDNPTHGFYGQQYKTLDYEYDLISGNVNKVSYQKGETDQYYHKYCYDSDNRIIEAYTSSDNLIWNNDANYFYNLHGPLARTEIGDEKVQGIDFAYTIHGWLKGVNSNSIVSAGSSQQDIGKDGLINPTYPFYAAATDVHSNMGRDAHGFSLSYYSGDFVSITSNGNNFLTDVSSLGNQPTQLFNGNIGQMAVSLTNLTETPLPLQATNYQYDQVNRITGMQAFNNVTNYTLATANEYNTSYAYDANGNLERLNRKATSNAPMDDLEYFYYDDLGNVFDPLTQTPVGNPTNKLAYVKDNGPATNQVGNTAYYNAGFNDLASQNIYNYTYDEIGNLISDASEEIEKIEWTVYGKIASIKRISASLKPDISFKYDASGNRVRKTIKDNSDIDESDWEHIHYQRDASGNVMAVYKQTFTVNATNYYQSKYELIEHPIYGSQRIGNVTRNLSHVSDFTATIGANGEFVSIVPDAVTPFVPAPNKIYENESGNKVYELTNHLGNVLATLSDRKIAVDDGVYDVNGIQTSSNPDGNTDYYTADVLSYSDYYPFGSLMPQRYSGGSDYRYGFNGYEKDDEVNGVSGGHLDFAGNGYDPRLGRRWNTDPLTASTPWRSPYTYAGDNPITNIDVDGERDVYFVLAIDAKTGTAGMSVLDSKLGGTFITKTHYQIHYKSKDGTVSNINVSRKTFKKFQYAFATKDKLTRFENKKLVPQEGYDSTKDGNPDYVPEEEGTGKPKGLADKILQLIGLGGKETIMEGVDDTPIKTDGPKADSKPFNIVVPDEFNVVIEDKTTEKLDTVLVLSGDTAAFRKMADEGSSVKVKQFIKK